MAINNPNPKILFSDKLERNQRITIIDSIGTV